MMADQPSPVYTLLQKQIALLNQGEDEEVKSAVDTPEAQNVPHFYIFPFDFRLMDTARYIACSYKLATHRIQTTEEEQNSFAFSLLLIIKKCAQDHCAETACAITSIVCSLTRNAMWNIMVVFGRPPRNL